ncbi:TetR family transcriptional regulator [Sinobacterium caligoides]|uniref:TetR family transcriptional regulator n=1 Tax=Sinobacterium caligoides TaxID=933926 RepID=A0A3N2DQ03_9GAMM|nr:TetR/AcrR family transcriptional regulator [Sinobacterium caligoides]ROS01860.1 TetR family transcriptional regulator [Sinobacterium caligoides]
MPKIVDHDLRRNEIAAVTLRVIQRAGVDGATFRSTAEEGGFSRGVVPHYFRDKEQLISFVFDWVANNLIQDILNKAEQITSALAKLRLSLISLLSEDNNDSASIVYMSFWSQAVKNSKLQQQHRLNYLQWRGLVKGYMQEAVHAGDICNDININDESDILISAVDGLCIATMLEHEQFPYQRAEALIDSMLARLLTKHN